MNPNYNPNANYFSNLSATSPEKAKYVNNIAGSPGSYRDVPIKPGTDSYVAEQVRSIDGNNPTGNPTNNVDTPNSTNTSTANPAEDAFSSYLKSLQQPDEVTEATKYVNSLITQGKLDNEKALSMGDTLGFATGEAARVGRQNSIALDAASRGLDALITSNASKKEIAKARYDYEKAKLDAEKGANPAFELSPGQSRYAYNKATGKYEKIASIPSAPKETSAADKKAVLDTDINQAVDQLGKIVKAKGFRGVPPDDYNEMRSYLQDTYGVDGVIELDKAMKALGLTVDNDWAALDAKLKK